GDGSDGSDVSDVSDVSDGSDVPDVCLPGEGCFGEPCKGNADCLSGWCVWHLGSKVCTDFCTDQCPTGWDCKEALPGFADTPHVCLSDFSLLCWPCFNDLGCFSDQKQQLKCVGGLPSGTFCSAECSGDGQGDCPEGYLCLDLADESGKACRPASNGCLCSKETLAAGTKCFVENEYGKCGGIGVCEQAGQVPSCDAPTPVAELCDNKDNDCDGQKDEGLSGNSCDIQNGFGTCKGVSVCDGSVLYCEGTAAALEKCDGQDNDCDGQADEQVDCTDGNPCTDDSCGGALGCQSSPNTAACDDQDICTDGDACSGGSCSGKAVSCDDGYSCTTDTCDPAAGCVHKKDNTKCIKNDCVNMAYCSANPIYQANLQPGTGCFITGQTGCNDKNECTKDTCDWVKGCQFEPVDGACDDKDPCTVDDVCSAGTCKPGLQELSCDDGNPCTDDWCAEGIGCVHDPNTGACDDNNACTVGDVCMAAACQPGLEALDCDDQNPCTVDTCDPAKGDGCVHVGKDGPSCSDGNLCTVGDKCDKGGACVPGPADAACAADLDWDNDGIANDKDACPYAFDPTNPDTNGIPGADACEPLAAHGLFMSKRNLDVKEAGNWPTSRRTSEPLEVPLMTGYGDASVLGWWPMEATLKDSGPYSLTMTSWFGEVFGDGIIGAKSHVFDGKSIVACTKNPPQPTLAMSFAAWVKLTKIPPDGKQAVLLMHAGMPGQQAGVRTVKLLAMGGKTYLSLWTWNGQWSQVDAPVDLPTGKWMHIAATHDGLSGNAALYLDGQLLSMVRGVPKPAADPGTEISDGGIYLGGARIQSTSVHTLEGYMDEALLLARVLQPAEVMALYAAKAGAVASLVPGAQKDFDDVRVEESPHTGMEEPGKPYVTRTQLIGVRPHSDTPCVNGGSGTVLSHRDDLCGVAAYWPMDTGLKENKSGFALQCTGGEPYLDKGRFGDTQGSLWIQNNQDACSAGDIDAVDPGAKSLTIEFWVRRTFQPHLIVAYPVQKKGVADTSGYEVVFTLKTGLVSCEFFGGSGQTVSVASLYGIGGSQFVSDPRWVHVACVLDRDKKEVRTYLDGTFHAMAPLGGGFGQVANSSPLVFGETSGPGDVTLLIDDVVIHDVAKSDDYIYNRANPGFPAVRFLANTVVPGAGTPAVFAGRGYTLHWGNASAKLVQPFVVAPGGEKTCHGLLNPCLGYALWLRFDEIWGDWVVDSSQYRAWGKLLNYGAAEAFLAGAPGGAGMNLPAFRVADVNCGPQCGVTGPHTVEATFKPTKLPSSENKVLVSRYKPGGTEFLLGLSKTPPEGQVTAKVVVGGGECQADSTSAMAPGVWQSAAFVFDGGLTVHANGTKSVDSQCPLAPASDFSKLFVGDIGGLGGDIKEFVGVIDSVRIMTRALTPDEMLKPIPLSAAYGSVQ
ncbi:MAG: LamG domain-containing protein, partial [Deltaproteobacteria bacterium]|nr:LamG domain-containing protein [Deltaproteobacteria bacterium]